ncbi:MAG: tetratricopeptide repeat protein [Firmicutes bacterium]|nr:tetratricopeptide repeat protein [Bacillota bacterium]
MKERTNMTLGENLKSIRKELGLRQHEIVGDEITRNLISMIENNKTPLYYRTAKLIADNINRISKERNLDIHIDPEDIMDPRRIEAKKQADRYIEKLQSYIRNNHYEVEEYYIREIEAFLKKWNISDKKVVIYELLGKISYHYNDLQRQYNYLTRGLENYFVNPIKKDIHKLVMSLIGNCIFTGRYREAINLSNLDCMSADRLSDELKVKLNFNVALAYKNLERYDKALYYLQELKKYIGSNNSEGLRKSLILEGICYNEKGQEDKAIEIYLKAIQILDDEDKEKAVVYANILDIYVSQKDKERAEEYRNKLVSLLPIFESANEYISNIYYNLAEASELLGQNDLAEEYYKKSIIKAVEFNKIDYAIKGQLTLLDLYSRTNSEDKIVSNKEIFTKVFEHMNVSGS